MTDTGQVLAPGSLAPGAGMPALGEQASRPSQSALAMMAAAIAVAACGGGASRSTQPDAAKRIASALGGSDRRVRTASATDQQPRVHRIPNATSLMDWAERQYPDLFPGHQADVVSPPFVYRYYPATQNAVGVQGHAIYVLGPGTSNELLYVGALADFAPLVEAARFPASDVDAVRFLHQAQYGATEEGIAAVRARGYGGWLHDQFEMSPGQSGGAWLDASGYGVVDEETRFFLPAHFGDRMAWAQLFTRRDTLRTRFALALSEYFVVSITGINSVGAWVVNYGAAGYWDQLCKHAFGNFRELLEAVTLNFVMGAFLGTLNNLKEDPATGRVPDENYAREVMQLFTIGLYELDPDGTERRDANGQRIETYTLDDVTGLARVFTGWTGDWAARKPIPVSPMFAPDGLLDDTELCRRPMVCSPWNHSTRETSFLGVHIPANTDPTVKLKTALDTLFIHPNVGPFFGRQMIQRLVTSNPSPAYVKRVAAAFDNNGRGVRGDLRAVLAAILLDDEARERPSGAHGGAGKLREPIVRLVQWAHTFGDAVTLARWHLQDTSAFADLGQSPLRSPSVFNFFRPGYVPPGTEMARSGATAPEFQIVNESTCAGYINFMYQRIRNGVIHYLTEIRVLANGTKIDATYEMVPLTYVRELAMAGTPDALVARLNLLLAAGRLSADSEALIANAVGRMHMPAGDTVRARDRVAAAVLMVMSSPEYLVQR